MHFDKFLYLSTFQYWKTNLKTEPCSCSSFPVDAMLRIKDVEVAKSVDDLMTSRSIGGHVFPNFEMAKVASTLKRIITNPYFRSGIKVEEQHAQKHDRFLGGRQIAQGAHEAALDLSDLFTVSLQGDDIQDFDTRWDQALLPASGIPKENVLNKLYKIRIREPVQLQTVLATYKQKFDRDRAMPSYQRLKTMARQQIRRLGRAS